MFTPNEAREIKQVAKTTHQALYSEYNQWTFPPKSGFWVETFVAAEQPIPEAWRSEFYEQLCSPNEAERKRLEKIVKFFGVRFV